MPDPVAVRRSGVVVLVLLLLALQAGGDTTRLLLRYERGAVWQGEVWRLFSAHLVHLGWFHCLLNACGLLLCRSLAPARFGIGRLALDVLLLGAFVSLMLLVFSPEVGNYAGLSGVLYGLFVLGLAPAAVQGDRIGLVALLTVLGWMAWQFIAGPSVAEEKQIGGHIVAVAHLYGVIGAVLMLALERSWRLCVAGNRPTMRPLPQRRAGD